MKLELNTSICPIIDVGLYHSRLSPEYMFGWAERELQCSEAITKEEKDYFFNKVSFSFNTAKYKELIVMYAAAEIEDYFNDIRDLLKIRRCGEASIDSPSYYNYRTDCLLFDVEIGDGEIQKIRKTVVADAGFFAWTDRYKSSSGFISFMPHTKEGYLRAIGGNDLVRAVAMYITYIGEKNCHLTENVLENSYQSYLEENIFGNNSYDDFIEDDKCLVILEKLRIAG